MIVVANMARLAGHAGVSQSEREADGWRGVIAGENSSQPGIECLVTSLTLRCGVIRRISGVRWIRGFLPIGVMAGIALRG